MATFDDIFWPAALKIDRANLHINDLNRQINAFLERKPLRIITEDDYRSGSRIIRSEENEPIPDVLSLVIGDAIHNLRAALDIALFGIVGSIAPDPSKVQFPFARSSDSLERAIKKGQACLARKEVVDEIKALQPYPGGRYGLHDLHMLDITDKHRLLLTTTVITVLNGKPFAEALGRDWELSDRFDIFFHKDAVIDVAGVTPRLSRERRRAMGCPAVVKTDIDVEATFAITLNEAEQTTVGHPVVAKLQEFSTNATSACRRIIKAHVS